MEKKDLKLTLSPWISPQPSVFSRFRLFLRLGRVSNLPTVWTNTLAGVVLAGGSLKSPQLAFLLVAFTLFYTGGMFLNDAFDRDIDARERSDRPIPSKLISAKDVFSIGYGMIGIGLLIVISLGRGRGWEPSATAVVLAVMIIGYDAYHKGNPVGPLIMGVCRMLIYVTAALAFTGAITAIVVGGAITLFVYVVGLTYVAKQKKALPHTIGALIAGIALLDGLLMAVCGAIAPAAIAVCGFFLTRRWQYAVEGT